MDTQQAFNTLKEALQNDKEYAHSWHCNLAMSMFDALPPVDIQYDKAHKVSNDGASRFMKLCFDVETSNDMLD